MKKRTPNPQLANDLSIEAFGTSLHDRQLQSYAPVPVAYINDARRIVRRDNILGAIETWEQEERTRNCKIRPGGRTPGWKRGISVESLLILMLVHVMDGKGVVFTQMAQTLKYRMGPKQFAAIGISKTTGTYAQWYDRLLNTKDHLEKLIDSLPGNRRKIPTEETMVAIARDRANRASELRAKEVRLHLLMNELVESSVKLLRKDIRDRFLGNIALDATKIHMYGQAGVNRGQLRMLLERMGLGSESDEDLEEPKTARKKSNGKHSAKMLRCINYDCGYYRREGNHDGTNSGKNIRRWALEMEIAIMTANHPGDDADFPLLAVAVGYHRPGAVTRQALGILRDLERREYRPRHLFVDMGYLPISKPEDLQGPARDMGWTPVFDYKVTELGQTTPYKDLIQVEGQWYVSCMPKELVNAEKEYRIALRADRVKVHDLRMSAEAKAKLREIRDGRRAERENYRLKPKGVPRPDGSQRFLYPDPDGYLSFDANTGEELPKTTCATVAVPRDVGLKYGQKYVHHGMKWRGWYGLRSTIEAFNGYIKDPIHTDIEAPGLRRARGNTFAYLVATLVIVAANVRKIASFLTELHAGHTLTTKNKYETIAQVELEELEMIEAELLADGIQPPPR